MAGHQQQPSQNTMTDTEAGIDTGRRSVEWQTDWRWDIPADHVGRLTDDGLLEWVPRDGTEHNEKGKQA